MDAAETVAALMQEGKGILLSGESSDAETERLAAFGAASEDARKTYRELLITTPGIEEHLSGIVLSPEAAQESSEAGTSLPELIVSKGIASGIMPDAVADDAIPGALAGHASRGISFAVFMADVPVADAISEESERAIRSLARRAKMTLGAGMAPVVALDMPMYGAHAAAHAEDMLIESLSLLADSLQGEGVQFSQAIIGVSMAVSGSESPTRASAAEVAERTARAATTAIPQETAGVVFLSDAQSPEEATANLNALARLEPLPWPIAFCFSRALQDPVLAAWKGSEENLPDAQETFIERLSLLSRADAGGYSATLEES